MATDSILKNIDLMEASGTDVFFMFTTEAGASGKTPIMTPSAARTFLAVSAELGTVFTFIRLGRAEQF